MTKPITYQTTLINSSLYPSSKQQCVLYHLILLFIRLKISTKIRLLFYIFRGGGGSREIDKIIFLPYNFIQNIFIYFIHCTSFQTSSSLLMVISSSSDYIPLFTSFYKHLLSLLRFTRIGIAVLLPIAVYFNNSRSYQVYRNIFELILCINILSLNIQLFRHFKQNFIQSLL